MLAPYFYLCRLHRPLPILLVLYPSFWALFAAQGNVPSWELMVIFAIGGLLIRSAGCIVNDIADRHYDGQVERTKHRPLATGQITVAKAMVLMVLLCIMAFLLTLLLNGLVVKIALAAGVLIVFYPFCKRFFGLPQLVLGLVFNTGVLMGYAAVVRHLPVEAWLLYGASVAWTLAYDTIYALADQKDDVKIGLKSSAVTFGELTYQAISGFQMLAIIGWLAFGLWHQYDWLYFIALMVVAFLFHLQYRDYRQATIQKCIKAFSDNHWVGLVIFLAIFGQFYV